MLKEGVLEDFIRRGFSEQNCFELIFGLTDAEYRHALKKVKAEVI